MNKTIIIGNVTKQPEVRTANTASGQKSVCTFTVAVNRRGSKDDADFFRVTAWGALAENCGRYLAKGHKVCVSGPVSVRQYTTSDGQARASLEITANEVEFLSARQEQPEQPKAQPETLLPADDEPLPF